MSIEKHKLNRKKIKPIIGHFFKYNSATYKITQLIDFHEVIGVNINTNEVKRLLIKGLQPIDNNEIIDNGYIHKDIDNFSSDDWKEIERRLNAIRPLLEGFSRKEIEKHSKEIGIHYTTLYRWKKGYDSVGNVMGLLPSKKGRKKGTIFIEEDIERIINDVIENHYLTIHKPSIKSVINKVKIKCLDRNLTFPSDGTIRNRISQLSAKNG
jgi:putative transposase